ncbi:hypothetical protein [Melghirimyces algeriensis]|uniref:Uncharacterized protein n=1 Tax=Melghirimyces algeriensis TaxID=910412 RepID=A0A521DKW5_9BACL|nr:hypothetical protein [Melghirimyces algeriensis]SMO72336.1 hypothetical protein SAMN06264849_106113 [Melghirimyces algeriensis]
MPTRDERRRSPMVEPEVQEEQENNPSRHVKGDEEEVPFPETAPGQHPPTER